MRLEGVQPKGIVTSSVVVPKDIAEVPLDSLNYAFTRLSERYEPWRKSHTGNIYTRVLYQERHGLWYPLEILRNAAEAQTEHSLIQDQWRKICAKLGLQTDNASGSDGIP